LRGDGTAQSVRTGILAAASIAAYSAFGRTSIWHYERRLAVILLLAISKPARRSTGFGETWREELFELARADPSICAKRDGMLDFSLRDGSLLKVH
jgi:hypothetical protein